MQTYSFFGLFYFLYHWPIKTPCGFIGCIPSVHVLQATASGMEKKNNICDSLQVSIPDLFALDITFRTGLVSSTDTASFSSDFLSCACAGACVYEPSEVFQGSVTWHINTSCCTFEGIAWCAVSGKGEWFITQHDTMFFTYVK